MHDGLSGKPTQFLSDRPRRGRLVLVGLLKKAARRRIKEGFPVAPHNMDVDEVRTYLSGDVIICLLCGQSFRTLAAHLKTIHGVSSDEYRVRYGLPLRRGLTCKSTHAINSAHAKRKIETGITSIDNALPFLDRKKAHRRSSFKDKISGLNAPKCGYKRLTERDYVEFANRTLTGRSVTSVSEDPDTIGITEFYKKLSEDVDFASWYHRQIEATPFSVQLKLKKLGERFDSEVARLHSEGCSLAEIGRRLGIKRETVAAHFRTLKKLGP